MNTVYVKRIDAPTYPVQVTFNLTPAFLQDIMTTAVESAYEWFAFKKVQRLPDDAEEQATCITSFDAIETDEMSSGSTVSRTPIDAQKIAEAIGKIVAGGKVAHGHAATLALCCASNDASDIDADLADCILQVACFDEIRYG